MEGLAKCGIWTVTAPSSHTSWHTPAHRLYKKPFVWNKTVWLLLQHNLFFITSKNVISSASNKKKSGSRIFHCDFKLFHYKTEVLGCSFFSKKVLHENLNFWRCQNHYFVLPYNIKKKNCFLQKESRKLITSFFTNKVSSVKHYHLALIWGSAALPLLTPWKKTHKHICISTFQTLIGLKPNREKPNSKN